jgi:hypothetical protein
MPWVALAGAAIGAAGSYMGGKESGNAGKQSAKAINRGIDFQSEVWKQGRKDLRPWRETGANALNDYYSKVQAGPGEFEASPGYAFRLAQGEKSLERAASARGRTFSGSQLKALSDYNQGMASNEYGNFLNQYYQSLTPYESIANMGLSAATSTASLGGAAGSNVANLSSSLAGSYQNAGQAQSNMWTNMANTGTNAIGNYYAQSMYNGNNNNGDAMYTSGQNQASATFR